MRGVLARVRPDAVWSATANAARHLAQRAGVWVATRVAERLIARAPRRVASPVLLVISMTSLPASTGPVRRWFEKPGVHHQVSVNASDIEPARLLAVLIVDAADEQLTIPDPQ